MSLAESFSGLVAAVRSTLVSWLMHALGKPGRGEFRVGILVIGSLLWESDADGHRERWRSQRLKMPCKSLARVPIRYGKKAKGRNYTFTMTFEVENESPQARAIVIPCLRHLTDLASLTAEAEALWSAEHKKLPASGAVSAAWGCVGVLWRDAPQRTSLLGAAWSDYFRKNVKQPNLPVTADGLLDIDWPNDKSGNPVDFDLLLATATEPEQIRPNAVQIADAWINGHHEYYFFKNIRSGIRTADDLAIWSRMEQNPAWLEMHKEYSDVFAILRGQT